MPWGEGPEGDEFRQLWDDGVPTAEMARRLGITKNAVIGKVHRLGLKLRRETKSVQEARRRERHRARLADMARQLGGCAWPIGDPREYGFHFCGAKQLPNRPYCLDHCRVAYVRFNPNAAPVSPPVPSLAVR